MARRANQVRATRTILPLVEESDTMDEFWVRPVGRRVKILEAPLGFQVWLIVRNGWDNWNEPTER